MLNFLPAPLKGAILFLLVLVNTVFWAIPLFAMAILKFIIPLKPWRLFCNRILNWLASNWIACNNLNMRLMHKIRWRVEGVEGLEMEDWYLVLSNHQSWSDIMVLQKVFNRRIPFLKFFTKQELIWVPILGLAWWALDYPFMKRYSKEEIEKHPELKGKDIETTRKACEKFREIPVSIMNFVEGTRFTREKHDRQGSPHEHLLKPRPAGTAFVLAAMGEQLRSILNVTIVYPQGAKNIWGFLCGRAREVRVRVESLPITRELLGDYFGDLEFRERFHAWLNRLWEEKDRVFEEMLLEAAAESAPAG